MRRNFVANIVILIVAVGCVTLAGGCALTNTWQSSRAHSVPLGELLVDASVFPEGWTVDFGPYPLEPEDARDAGESLEIGLQKTQPYQFAQHEVYRFKNELQSVYAFRLTSAEDFISSEMKQSDWKTPAGWTYRSPIASEFEFACAEFKIIGRYPPITSVCVARARYGEFVSIFVVNTPIGNMTLQDVERILRDIDSKMEKYLK